MASFARSLNMADASPEHVKALAAIQAILNQNTQTFVSSAGITTFPSLGSLAKSLFRSETMVHQALFQHMLHLVLFRLFLHRYFFKSYILLSLIDLFQ